MIIGAIIQARMNSNRLPGKVIMNMPIHSQKTILDQIINRIPKGIKYVIATSTNDLDNQIVSRYSSVFCGSEEDVLSRFYEISVSNNFDSIIRLTGDNPCIDTHYLQKTIEFHIKNNSDYTYSTGLPIGCNLEVFSFKALSLASRQASTQEEKEHVTLFMKRAKNLLNLNSIEFKVQENIRNLRLTIDYPSDFAFVNLLYSVLGPNFGLSEIAKLLANNKWMTEINSANEQLQV